MGTTGKHIWILGKTSMTKRAFIKNLYNNSVTITTQDNTQTCPTCVCCSTNQVELYNAKAMVFCCMDFRLRDNMVCQLNLKGYKNNYDEVIAAGSSLGYNGLLDYKGWDTYVDEHISLAFVLHKISQIIVIDHEKCGAVTEQYGALTKEEEYILHVENLTKCAETLWNKYNPNNGTKTKIPNLEIITYIISIDGCLLTEIYKKTS